MTQGLHDELLCFIAEFKQLAQQNDLNKHRIEIGMTNGTRHWVKMISEEWEDAIRVVTESDIKPIYLMKHCIQSMSLVLRPMAREVRDG